MFTPILLLYFITTVLCGPIYSRNCLKPIHFEMNTQQGLNPDLNTQLPFGYVYNIGERLVADMPIQQSTSSLDIIPHEAAIVLSHISMNSKLILKGRISEANADKLKKTTLNTQFKDIRVDSFAFDKASREWYSNLRNNIPDGISGKVLKMDIIQHVKGENSSHEVVIELAPTSSLKDQLPFCKLVINNNVSLSSAKDRFNEIIDSAILL